MTQIIKDNGARSLPFDPYRLERYIDSAAEGIDIPDASLRRFKASIIGNIQFKDEYTADQITNLMLMVSSENTSVEEPDWTYLSAEFFLRDLYKKAAKNRCYDPKEKYGSLYTLVKRLAQEGIYAKWLLAEYTEEEINRFSDMINPEMDKLFTYAGLLALEDKYLATDHAKNKFELPQERFMIIAMTLMVKEKAEQRVALVQEAYWALSSLYMTVATPTLANAGKSYGQLSSCFIDTMGDDLKAIYGTLDNIAQLSKNGGGIGIYMGHVRSLGSDIKGFKGVCGGTVPWTKLVNETAISVDQLGQRQGAMAVYLDVWHQDIFSFLDLRLNTGDERKRARDIFTGVCIPDLFMEKVESRGDWYLFDPHQVYKVTGKRIEDHFDEVEEFDEEGNRKISGSFREFYYECVNNNDLDKRVVPAIDIMKGIMRSQLETGTPYMFYRDQVNRENSQKHEGMIYCSNLCTEITQNQSQTYYLDENLDLKTGRSTQEKVLGDMVVCNLSSINLARAVTDDVLERLIPIQVRMLDNVIDLNDLPLAVAKYTNHRYRAIGLGTYGLHDLLVQKKIRWESQEAVDFNDSLYEDIAYYTIKASMELAKEKEEYPLFEGSEWETGEYFARKGYIARDTVDELSFPDRWEDLAKNVMTNGMRNAYLMAVAPNSSTAIIAGTTASIDPVFRKVYQEEKGKYRVVRTAPGINPTNQWFYKTAYVIDQNWSILQNAARQKHIDQAVSFNLYVPSEIKAKELLDLHMTAWRERLKTTYYVRSQSQEVIDECESCHS
ncbi:ribonucleotide reductase large subunit [Bacillus phage Slash]|uniref:Ribonucleoside-diphosphate reductase n=1 Tax=Bacillus phage Slash TaxID=1406790 RepID=U5PX55_9CAUD|nr:ribonucleotide reductase large subunit [Bacillus phage Slash]AGY48376.1 ribonucleoside-diphosphate reductase subunit alpha [Bacillus phage Slash]